MDKNIRVTIDSEAWREWMFYVNESPGEVSVLGQASINGNNIHVYKFHLVKQTNTSSNSDMDDLAVNQLIAKLAVTNEEQSLIVWLHSHGHIQMMNFSGTDHNNIRQWGEHGGTMLVSLLCNKNPGNGVVGQVDIYKPHRLTIGVTVEIVQSADNVKEWRENYKANCTFHGMEGFYSADRLKEKKTYFPERRKTLWERAEEEEAKVERDPNTIDMFDDEQDMPGFELINEPIDLMKPTVELQSLSTLKLIIKGKMQALDEIMEKLPSCEFGSKKYSDATSAIMELEGEIAELSSEIRSLIYGTKEKKNGKTPSAS